MNKLLVQIIIKKNTFTVNQVKSISNNKNINKSYKIEVNNTKTKYFDKSFLLKNNKQSITNNQVTIKYRMYLLFIYFIKIILITPISSEILKLSKIRRLDILSEITIKINSKGSQNIVNSNYYRYPDEIYLNEKNLFVSNTCNIYLENESNIIKMIWNNSKITTCKSMFLELSNITEINLSKFDTSLVTEMQSMFKDCLSLNSIDLTNFNTSLVTDMNYMFFRCELLLSIDLSSFNTSLVRSMANMFSGCSSFKSINLLNFNTSLVTDISSFISYNILLKSIDLFNFDTSSVEKMDFMFYHCISLESLDLSNFKTSLVNSMKSMFSDCISLKELDLSSFDTSLVTTMESMFWHCDSITSLNLLSFNTSSVKEIVTMFAYCGSLLSLDLSSFDTSKITNMNKVFIENNKLKTINLSSFNTSSINSMYQTFSGCNSLISLDLSNFNTLSVENMRNMFERCHSLTFLDLSSFNTSNVYEMSFMFDSCISLTTLDLSCFDTSSLKNASNMFSNCISLKSLDLSSFNTSNVTNMNNMFSNCKNLNYINLINLNDLNVLQMNNILTNTPENIVFCIIENNAINLTKIIMTKGCSIIDCTNNWKEKQRKIIAESNTCIENCSNNSKYIYEYENKCYESCPNGTYSNNYFCTNENLENNEKTTLKPDYQICNVKEFFLNECKMNLQTKEEKELFIETITKEIMNGSIYEIISLVVNEKKNIIIQEDNEIYQISTLSTQSEIKYNNISSIDFGECEDVLRRVYNIHQDKEIIIFKIEHFIIEYKIPIIEYALFTEDGRIKLNLDYCNNISIQYHIPVSIDENELYKYDPESFYYSDICIPYTTVNRTDITLYDRKNEYNNNNMSLCENNCIFRGYNSSNKNVDCECKVKSTFSFFSNINIDKKKLLNLFINIKKISNILVIKCYELLFSQNGLISNIGNYIILSILFITIIESIILCIKEYNLFSIRIKEIIQINFKNNNIILLNDDNFYKKKRKSDNIKTKKKNIKLLSSLAIPPKKNAKRIKKNNTFSTNKNSNLKHNSSIYNLFVKNNKKKNLNNICISKNNKKNKNIDENKGKNDYELNTLPYKDALKYDKRTYWEYYFSLIRTKHSLVFTFYTKTDYNSRLIKVSLFFFLFALVFTVNALFFNDSTMHQIYEDEGKFNFVYQIPQILYSAIISSAIKIILTNLSLTEKKIIKIKEQKTLGIALNETRIFLKCLKIKFIFVFLFQFIFLLLFWYYLSCFCAVYKNTQLFLIEDTFISFGTSLLYPFIIYLIPGVFRIPSLNSVNNKRECMYTISKLIQLFI